MKNKRNRQPKSYKDQLNEVTEQLELNKKEVLFFALSSFRLTEVDGKKLIEGPNRLLYGKETLEEYYYQMEPVLKLFKHMGKTPEAVVMLYTPETETKVEFFKRGDDKKYEQSPKEYMEEKIKEYWPESGINYIKWEKTKKDVAVIKEVLETLRTLNTENKKEFGGIRLSIDIHGGFRDIQMIIQSIVSLIRYDEIELGESYSVRFGKEGGEIFRADNTIDINQFVMGMNEFLLYGRGYSLERYYNKVCSDEKLAEIIKDISESIQLCHVSEFDNAIYCMREYMKKYKDNGDYTDIFIETIKKSYGELLADDKSEMYKVFNKVKWCLNNDFIQQALTIIESEMPTEYLNRNIIKYKTDDDGNVQLVDKDGNSGKVIPIKDAINWSKQNWERNINFAFAKWGYENIATRVRIKGNKTSRYTEFNVEPISLDSSKRVRIKSGRYKDRYYFDLGFDLNKYIITGSEEEKDIIRLFNLHLSLKDERNSSNHGDNSKRASYEEVKTAIEAYVRLAEKVYSECKKK